MLGYSIQKHNDLAAMGAEMVLLVRVEGADGVSKENITRLESVGWKVRIARDLEFENVDNSKIRAHHRHNLNKLHLWSWTEYEKILFIDADVVCKGSLKELWDMPGGILKFYRPGEPQGIFTDWTNLNQTLQQRQMFGGMSLQIASSILALSSSGHH